jgi:FkbM family methyltransferase
MSSNSEKNKVPLYQLTDVLLRAVLRRVPPLELSEQLALWWGYRFRPAPRISRLRSGPLIWTAEIDHLQLLIYYLGTFEPHCLPYLRAVLPLGGTVLDVGANIGVYSIESAAVVGPAGRVIAIEAAAPHAASLRHNLKLNSFSHVSVFETAVGAVAGSATLRRRTGDNLGMYSLGAIEGVEAEIVSVRTIDDVLVECQITELDLIKMDIEGSEYNALVGATKSLQQFRPAILIEINDAALRSCGSSARQVLDLLHGLQYRGWEIGRNALRSLDQGEAPEGCTECIFVHPDHAELPRRLGLAG